MRRIPVACRFWSRPFSIPSSAFSISPTARDRWRSSRAISSGARERSRSVNAPGDWGSTRSAIGPARSAARRPMSTSSWKCSSWCGRAIHRSGRQSTPLHAGDIVFADHAAPHRFEGETKDFEVVILCFLPSALGYSDALLGDRATMDDHALLVPFSPGEGEPLHFAPRGAGLQENRSPSRSNSWNSISGRSRPRPARRGDALRLLLSLIVHEARGRAPSAASAVPFKEVLDLLRARFRRRSPWANWPGASAWRPRVSPAVSTALPVAPCPAT